MTFARLLIALLWASSAVSAEFNIQDYGSTPNDETDDTKAILEALAACEEAGGGKVFIPRGTYIVSKEEAKSPILEVPSNTVVCGEGAASVLRFDPRVTNFWRMLGARSKECHNVTIRDLHLDGSNKYTEYKRGVPEHNQGIWFYRPEGGIENITIENCLIENFAGDCIGISRGCRNVTIRNATVRNFLRQGIQLAGGNGARDYLVTGCRDLEGTVRAGGTTIHVEHARGLTGVIITGNHCRKSIGAGGVDGMIISNNIVDGGIRGNRDKNLVVTGNVVRSPKDYKGSVLKFGYVEGLLVTGNVIISDSADACGIYVWGKGQSRDGSVVDNLVCCPGIGVRIHATHGGIVRGNLVTSEEAEQRLIIRRSEGIVTD